MSSNAAAVSERMNEIKVELAEKCAQDSAFREALLSDPQGTVEAEYGLDAGTLGAIKIKPVVQDVDSIVVPIPADMSDMELSEEQLDQVAGGGVVFGVVIATVSAAATAAVVAQRTRSGRRW